MKKRFGVTAFLVALGLPWISSNRRTLGVSSIQLNAVQQVQDQQSPVCPGRPFSVQPTETDVKNTGLSLELLCVVAGTYLERDLPAPSESPDLLRRYLEQPPYAGLTDEAYVATMREAVQLWPASRFSHAGLARAVLRGHRERTTAEKQQAATAYIRASQIAFSEGQVRYILELSELLGDIRDSSAIDWYVTRALALTPRESERYVLYLRFGRALGKAGDPRGEMYLQKAIATRPGDSWEAYEFYATFLLDVGRPKDVLTLLSPEFERAQIVPEHWLHGMRCRALVRMGRQAEAQAECDKARQLVPHWL